MTASPQDVLFRINQRLKILGISAADASIRATGKPDIIRDMGRKTPRMPSAARLTALARVLETSVGWLMGEQDAAEVVQSPAPVANAVHSPAPSYQQLMAAPLDVPVFGTALGADLVINGDGEIHVEQTILEMIEPISWYRRPPAFAQRADIYVLLTAGSSMSPRFRPGDPMYVDPRRPPSIGDEVVIHLMKLNDNGDDHELVTSLVKTLVRRTSTYVELEQYNPALTFRLPADRIAHIHRVIPNGELFGL